MFWQYFDGLATTSFCGFQRTVVTNSLGCDAPKSSAKSTTVLYTVNSKPVICENPFRKVFAKRKQFYQAKENRDSTSPETSSKKLLWRPCNHACRRNSLCPDNRPADPPSPRYFTLNANIQPFDAFTIRHHLNSEGNFLIFKKNFFLIFLKKTKTFMVYFCISMEGFGCNLLFKNFHILGKLLLMFRYFTFLTSTNIQY